MQNQTQNPHDSLVRSLEISQYEMEFPWIKRYSPGHQIRVSVQRVDRDLLSMRPDRGNNKKLFLISESGEELLEVGVEKTTTKRWLCFLPQKHDERRFIETVGESFFRLGKKDVDKIAFILLVSFANLYIYKTPKGFTLTGWMEEILKASRQRLEQEKAEADKVVLTIRPD